MGFLLALYVFGVALFLTVRLAQAVGLSGDRFLAVLAASRPIVLLLLAFTGCALYPLGNLVAFHSYLIATNTTTNEEITAPYQGSNPFSLGCVRNCRQFAHAPPEPTAIQPSKLVPPPSAQAFDKAPPFDAQV